MMSACILIHCRRGSEQAGTSKGEIIRMGQYTHPSDGITNDANPRRGHEAHPIVLNEFRIWGGSSDNIRSFSVLATLGFVSLSKLSCSEDCVLEEAAEPASAVDSALTTKASRRGRSPPRNISEPPIFTRTCTCRGLADAKGCECMVDVKGNGGGQLLFPACLVHPEVLSNELDVSFFFRNGVGEGVTRTTLGTRSAGDDDARLVLGAGDLEEDRDMEASSLLTFDVIVPNLSSSDADSVSDSRYSSFSSSDEEDRDWFAVSELASSKLLISSHMPAAIMPGGESISVAGASGSF
mmetsp:Transcript_44512/g.135672  ORF Transcript_44512/g.135672 Transcript_44512/m.135672 type:complete len:295 (-) Transcript_44512:244-1128(-)